MGNIAKLWTATLWRSMIFRNINTGMGREIPTPGKARVNGMVK
jgi:hypothetical protein